MPQGKIKTIVSAKGFGFIESPGNHDIFFHASSLVGVAFEDLNKGDQVEYDEEPGKDKKTKAVNVTLLP